MNDSNFSKIRSFLWPIHKHELPRFVPMLLLFFLVSFNYHILRILKDALIITAPNSGAEVIPFLKVWAILPSAIILTFLFTKLSSRLNREKIFYAMISIFLSFFVFFILVLYPNSDYFNLNEFSNSLANILPKGFKGFIAIIRYWHFSLFYIMSEAWSTIIMSLLLWVFIIDIISVDQAKRYYAFFGTFRNLAGVVSGFLGEYLAKKAAREDLSISSLAKILGCKTPWDQSLLTFITLILISGILIIFIYRYLHVYYYPNRYLMGGDPQNKGKQKISFKESILFVCKSKYVLCIASIVLSYNMVINLIEVLWKSQMNELYPSSYAFAAYTSKITCLTGIVATLSSFFISGNLIRRLGWKITALVTPVILFVCGISFFYFLFLKRYTQHAGLPLTFWGFSPLVLAVFFGSIFDVFSRTLKYTVFDDTKEMAFIPLTPLEKLKGKSAIDGIGSRLGKSGGSFLMQLLFMSFSTPMGASPYIFIIMLFIMPIWFLSINKLSKQFEEKAKAPKDLETTLT